MKVKIIGAGLAGAEAALQLAKRNINVDKLIYTYTYFFKYSNDIINDDWGTVRLIDEFGNAKLIK